MAGRNAGIARATNLEFSGRVESEDHAYYVVAPPDHQTGGGERKRLESKRPSSLRVVALL